MQDAPTTSPETKPSRTGIESYAEACGIVVLIVMAVTFLALSWRKWPDPIVDFGQQCYSFWRMSQSAVPYHDFVWNYGPFSLFINAALFKSFGSGIMVLVWANLFVYSVILAMAYAAFRIAWGWRGAFAACATFISVFSFSHLLGVGNYNYATPYAGEAVHGMALLLASALIINKWTAGESLKFAFLLGLAGGLAAVIKPEFMLALGVAGIGAVAIRILSHESPTAPEYAMIFAGLLLPTVFFTLLLSRSVPFTTAFVDASQAWWLVLVNHVQSINPQQQSFTGLSHPAANLLHELAWTGSVGVVIGAIMVSGMVLNRQRSLWKKISVIVLAALLAWECRMREGWFFVGRSLPGLMLIAFSIVAFRIWATIKYGDVKPCAADCMKAVLVLLSGSMLARMAFSSRVYHMGFFLAALAGMVVAAMMTEDLPLWLRNKSAGRRLAWVGCWCLLLYGCGSIAAMSLQIRADQTQAVGQGRDRFYSTKSEIEGTGAVVEWAVEKVAALPESARVMVLPEGTMINYLARRRSLDPGWEPGTTEAQFIARFEKDPPEYVMFITRDTLDAAIPRFGAEGNFGRDVVKWVALHYDIDSSFGGNPLALNDHPGAAILRLKKQPWKSSHK
jgi:hypothetical protein